MSVWRVSLQVHLGLLVFTRKLREGKAQEFSFSQIFVTVGAPLEWASTIHDLGRMNTVTLLSDLSAYLNGDARSALETQSYFEDLATNNLPLLTGITAGAGATAVGTVAKITFLSTAGASSLAAVSFFGIASMAGKIAHSPYWSSRNVSFLREAHENFMANEPIGSAIANSLFTSIWAVVIFTFSSFHDVTLTSVHYFTSFIFTVAPPTMLSTNATLNLMNETVLAEEVYGIVGEFKGSMDDLTEMANAQSFWDVFVIGIRFLVSIFFI